MNDDEPAQEPCGVFVSSMDSESLCGNCRWPYNFHSFSALSPRSMGPKSLSEGSGLKSTLSRASSSGTWGARPSSSAVLMKRNSVFNVSQAGSRASGSAERLAGGPPNKPLPSPVFSREPKEVAALLRRQTKTRCMPVDGSEFEYEGVFEGPELVLTLMQHCHWTRAESVSLGRQLLHAGYIAAVGSVTQSGFVDASGNFYVFIVLPDLAVRRGSASLDYGTIQWSSPPPDNLRPLHARSMSASVVGTAWRYNYRSSSSYMVYFIHILADVDDRFTVSRHFGDLVELHRALCRRYAARVLPSPPKERKNEQDNRAALQAYLVALIDCRFLATESEFVRFFRDMAADSAPLTVMRQSQVPLEEAFLLLGPSFRDVAMVRVPGSFPFSLLLTVIHTCSASKLYSD